MTAKLTLTIEKAIKDRAESYAKHIGQSLSELIENHLELISRGNQRVALSPKLKNIVGAVKLPESFDEVAELQSALQEKHLARESHAETQAESNLSKTQAHNNLKEKLLVSVELAYKRMIEFKKQKNSVIVVMRDNKIVYLKPEEA